MGYQATSVIVECPYVQNWCLKVKLKMAQVDETTADGTPTGNKTRLKPPHKPTNLLHELQKIQYDDEVVFHMAVVREEGLDIGISRVVVEYDVENNPRAKQKLKWAKHVLKNFPSWIYHFAVLIDCC